MTAAVTRQGNPGDSNPGAGASAGHTPAAECIRRAVAAHRDKRWSEAAGWMRQAVDLQPDNPEHHYTLARLQGLNGDAAAEEHSYRQALRLRPDYADAWISLGIALRVCGRLEEALVCQQAALRIDPGSFAAVLNLGNVLVSLGRNEDAEPCFRRAIEREPRSAEAHNNLGHALFARKFFDLEARTHLLAALEINPNYFEAAECLGRCLYRLGNPEGAIAAFSHAASLRADAFLSRLHLARAYFSLRRFAESIAEYERLLRDFNGVAEAKSGLAATLAAMGQYTKPRALFEEAVAEKPDNPSIRFDYALFLLRSGDFEKASEHYESRWEADHVDQVVQRGWSQPLWRGEPLAGKTLLITSEQGLGDEIMFASIFGEVLREADHVIVECDARLEPLFRRTFDATVCGVPKKDVFWYRGLEQRLNALPGFDYWVPAGTLMVHRRRSTEAFPRHSGYLQPDPRKAERWRDRLATLGPGLKIGISWRGGTARTRAAVRSLSLEQLRPILGTPGAHFVNLQYGDCQEEIRAFTAVSGVTVHHWQEAIDDYDETAALVAGLDLVISVCTAVIHLGGALGKHVWVMAPYVSEWRYGWKESSMIWYPSVRIFRQSRAEAWDPVIAEVKRELRKLPAGARASSHVATAHE